MTRRGRRAAVYTAPAAPADGTAHVVPVQAERERWRQAFTEQRATAFVDAMLTQYIGSYIAVPYNLPSTPAWRFQGERTVGLTPPGSGPRFPQLPT